MIDKTEFERYAEAVALTDDQKLKSVSEFGGLDLYIPKTLNKTRQDRDNMVERMLSSGFEYEAIRGATGLSERQIRRIQQRKKTN